jgi:hypothetical protein
MVGFKVLRSFYANCGYSVQTSAECKSDRSVMLTVMSGLDPHMVNKLKDENKIMVQWALGCFVLKFF